MTVHRIHKNKDYSVIHNEAVLSSTMTWKAKGILWYLLSRPDGWQCRTADLIEKSPQGKEAVTSALAELEENGYIVRWKQRGEKGQFEYFSEVFEVKADCDRWKAENADQIQAATRFRGRSPRAGKSRAGIKPSDGKTRAGKSGAGKQRSLLNTDQASTDQVNTDRSNTPPIVPQRESEPSEGEIASLSTAPEPIEAIADPTPTQNPSPVNFGGSPKQQLQDSGLGLVNKNSPAAAPRDLVDSVRDLAPAPWNFDKQAAQFDRHPCPVLKHYGFGHMAVGRTGALVEFAPRLVAGAKVASASWSAPLTRDGDAIAHLRKRLSQLMDDRSYQGALGFLEQSWELGEDALSDAQEAQERLSVPEFVPRPVNEALEGQLGFLRGKGTFAATVRAQSGRRAS